MVTIDHKLKVEQGRNYNSKNSKGPSMNWLDIVITHGAKGKIRKILKDENKRNSFKVR